jgi:lycopene beta-cyclase
MAEPIGRKQKDLRSDVIIVGGGFAGTITALKLLAAKSDRHIILVDAAEKLAGHHTWFFHESELSTTESLSWLAPLISKEWAECSYQFPRFSNSRSGRCFAIRSEDLRRVAQERLGDDIYVKNRATRLSESHVELESGRIIAARCVLDASGMPTVNQEGSTEAFAGYQKSISLEVDLESRHGLVAPVMIDATCPQLDGFRYYQLFPWSETRLQVSEIYYSDSPEINRERIFRAIRSFINRKGWTIKNEIREETRVIRLPLTSSYLTTSVGGDALPIGRHGGYFHATLGSSVADSIQIAEFLATIDDLTTQNARYNLLLLRRPWQKRQRFFRLINRWMFYATEPALRYVLMQKIIEQREDVIQRFASSQTTLIDRYRLLRTFPPAPWERLLRCFSEKALISWAETREQKAAEPVVPEPLDHAS